MSRMIEISPPGRLPLPDLREMWEAREVFWRFGLRDLMLRYRQTALGVIWVVLQPLLSAGVFAVVFGRIAGLDSGPVPYFVFSFTGMLAWNLFNGVVTRASASLVSNQALISKVFFPRVLVPLSSVVSVLVDFLVAGALLAVLLAVNGINPGLAVLSMPLWVLLTVMMAAGIGLAAAALMVSFRDIQYVVPFALQTLLYASPIAYPLSEVDSGIRWMFDVNPLTWLLEGFRWSLLGADAPAAWQVWGSAGAAVTVFFGGLLLFSKMERGMADVI